MYMYLCQLAQLPPPAVWSVQASITVSLLIAMCYIHVLHKTCVSHSELGDFQMHDLPMLFSGVDML